MPNGPIDEIDKKLTLSADNAKMSFGQYNDLSAVIVGGKVLLGWRALRRWRKMTHFLVASH
jgi:hypothetical protein